MVTSTRRGQRSWLWPRFAVIKRIGIRRRQILDVAGTGGTRFADIEIGLNKYQGNTLDKRRI